MQRGQRDAIIEHIAAKMGSDSYECVEVEWDVKEQTLRIFIDSPGGILVDHCAEISKLLFEDEELERLVGSEFQMEVSSPGVDRPLRTSRHFQAVIGRCIEMKLTESVDGRKHGSGILRSVGGDEVIIETNRGDWHAPLSKLDRANLVFDWEKWNAQPSS